MRGHDHHQQQLFSYISPEERVPKDHPLRPIKKMVNKALKELTGEFAEMYSSIGRPSIAPEKLLKALLLQVLFSIRSERMLIEQLDYNLLFRWFVGLSLDEPVWNHSSFSKNRERLINSDIAIHFLRNVTAQARKAGLLSDEHFSVDGTLVEAWASLKSFRAKDDGPGATGGTSGRNPTVNFHGEQRTNDTHESRTDPDARLYRKGSGKEAKLYYAGHVLMENRSGLVVDGCLNLASGRAERTAALQMVEHVEGRHHITVGSDKGYDTVAFIEALRNLNATAHVAQKTRGSAIDGRTTRHEGYQRSQRVRKRIEEVFGWLKTVGLLNKTRHRGQPKVSWVFLFSLAAYNLVRMRNLGVAG